MDVNEEIIKEWLHLCKGQFTIENITFKVYGKKGGSNYSNIDLLAVDKNGIYYDYEIKWRSVYSLSVTDKETPKAFINQLKRKERIELIKKLIGKKKYKKVFVTTYTLFGKSLKKREDFIRLFKKEGIEVLFFEDIISELVKKIEIKGRYDSPVLQTIRMLKFFNIIKQGE